MIRVAALCIGLVAATVGLADEPATAPASTRFVAIEVEPATGPATRGFSLRGRLEWKPFADPADYAATVEACMSYSPPPGAVGYTQDGSEWGGLRQDPREGEYDHVGSGVGHVPPPWAKLNPTPPMSGIGRVQQYGAIVFLHARKTNAGRELLTIVHWPGGGDAGLRVTLVELDPADAETRREASVLAIPRGALLAKDDPRPGIDVEQRLRFSAGRPDPFDASALTIDYAMAANNHSKYRPGSIWIRLTDEPTLAKYDWPRANPGPIPMLIEVTRPDGTIWIQK